MTRSIVPRRTTGPLLRWTAAVLLLAGLFAMHGLPMAGAGTSMSMSITAAATAAVGPGQPTSAAAVMSGCDGADHCTATLRAGGVTPPPALVATRSLDVAASALLRTVTDTRAARGPPPPDLQELCISRT